MIISTTQQIEGKKITAYRGLVFGEVVAGTNFIRDWIAGITDIFGGRSGTYERKLANAREEAIEEIKQNARKLGANAVIGVDIKYQTIEGDGKNMFMIIISGTAVSVE